MRWTVSEEIEIKKNFPDMTLKELAELFPRRSHRAVCEKARNMGLYKYNKDVKFKHNTGYIIVRDDVYPKDWAGVWMRREKSVYVYEHCHVWHEHYPDDKIQSNEVIHHVDGSRDNNDIKNLVKLTRSNHMMRTVLDEWEGIPGIESMTYVDAMNMNANR